MIRTRRVSSGQTLIMAMIILGVLLILGFVFVGIVNRNIRSSATSRTRSQAADLAEAGIRYAHAQLLNSPLGADWRGTPQVLNDLGGNFTRDPDALYLRPGTGYGLRNDADERRDAGGPDGLGPYVRANFSTGRSLIRVRYVPSDFNIFSTDPTGSLRNPGKARCYTIIESVGRPGAVNYQDPTTLLNSGGVQFQGFATSDQFRQALGTMRNLDSRLVKSRKIIAFASIGIIESSLFITNKYEVTTSADLGVPYELAATYNGADVHPPLQLGTSYALYDPGLNPTPSTGTVPGGGSVYSNAALTIYGNVRLNLNKPLGDSVVLADTIQGVNDLNSTLSMTVSDFTGAWTWATSDLQNLTSPSLDSRSNNFSTLDEMLRDGMPTTDLNGSARSGARKEPPTLNQVDPESGLNRYLALTRNSGVLTQYGNTGQWGYGQGVYIDNTYDRQIRTDADARADVGPEESLVYDWLNPNNGQERSGWKGPFYVPPGAYVQLLQDGFIISRDGTNRPPTAPDNQRTWRKPDGTDSGIGTLRFRIGNVNGVPYIVNTLTPGVNISATDPGYANGLPFNGVLYFEGNVRVRGVIPTDRQLTIVSNGTIYVEGSITKGVIDGTGARLTRPSRSMLMLMAKDYVAVNSTQFFGPSFGQTLDEVQEGDLPIFWNPLRIAAGDGRLNLLAEFDLDPDDPTINPDNPAQFRPFIEKYREYTGATDNGPAINSQLLLGHTMDAGAAPFAFVTMDINFGLTDSSYLFGLTPSNSATAMYGVGYVTPGYTTPGFAPIYGLGVDPWQRYDKFEQTSFPVLDMANATFNVGASELNVTDSPEGRYSLLLGETSMFTIKTTSMAAGATNDYLFARGAIVPHDVRIEASMFAEEGSFFVIPGNWFNPNVNDTRDKYLTLGTTTAERDQARKEAFGSYPATPFYGEPLDVRVTIVGAVSENMPPPISQQAEWVRKWGWIPRALGASGLDIPWNHVPADLRATGNFQYVPNLVITYDPTLATSRTGGFNPANPYVRTDSFGRPLPPMPRLPVSPTLSYFGEVNP